MFYLFLISFVITALIITYISNDLPTRKKVAGVIVLISITVCIFSLSEFKDNWLERNLIQDGKICYVVDKYGDTEVVLVDSTMIHTYAQLYCDSDTTQVKYYEGE
jgi:uncharacterized membrane protein